MKFFLRPLALAVLTTVTSAARADHTEAPVKTLGVITVTGSAPSSLPTQIPTTMEGVTQEQIETTINATDSEDALKYLPSLSIRKRTIGDYNHAVLASRASGANNSARSAVYADGILLSNFLGNGATFAPRWGMVTPEEIERVDVMYGPFSAAYPGNAVGAVVDYVTRMPKKFEAHVKTSAFTQAFDLYNTHDRYAGTQASASLGNRSGDGSWWFNVNHTDSTGQPLVIVSKPVNASAPAGTAVTGAVLDKDRTNQNIFILGTGTQYHTLQDHAKIKLAWDITPTVRASYLLGVWQNDAKGRSQSYLRDSAGNPIYSGTVNINGNAYSIAATDFGVTNEDLMHVMHGLSLKSNTRGVFDWEIAASRYDYSKDQLRTATTTQPGALSGGAGTITNQHGTGWNTLALKGTWRPASSAGAHIIDFGYQQENYTLRILKSNITGNWITDPAGSLNTDVGGKTQLQSLYGQDTWSFAPQWKTVLGARLEHWRARNGYTRTSSSALDYAARSETFVSPKAALAYQWDRRTVLKASLGRAVRMPTVNELYGATSGTLTVINDPTLKPEKSWTAEFTLEKDLGNTLLRATAFYEIVNDSLYSERISSTVTRIVNIGQIRTPGVELALQGSDVGIKGLDLSGSLTWANSRIVKNDGYVTTPGDTIGKHQPRVPVWRATLLATYRWNNRLTTSFGARYSGTQYGQLDNSDVNGYTYTAVSKFFTTDLRIHYKIDKQWSAAFGIDNLNNYKYWNFHPYPQRTYSAELKFDL